MAADLLPQGVHLQHRRLDASEPEADPAFPAQVNELAEFRSALRVDEVDALTVEDDRPQWRVVGQPEFPDAVPEGVGGSPADPLGHMVRGGYFNRQGNLYKTMEAWEERAKVEPNNPEAHHTIAIYNWEKVFKDYTLKADTKRAYLTRAVAAEDSALALHADYMEALTYKNILLRLQANMEKDQKKVKALIEEADRLRNRAMELQKIQAAAGK